MLSSQGDESPTIDKSAHDAVPTSSNMDDFAMLSAMMGEPSNSDTGTKMLLIVSPLCFSRCLFIGAVRLYILQRCRRLLMLQCQEMILRPWRQ